MHYSLNGEDNNRPVLGAGETILWDAKPKKSAYILSKSLILFPIAILWLIIDGSMLISAIQEGEMLYFLIPFFALLGAGLTALIGGFSTARLHKHAALLCGLGNGGLLLALMLLLSLGFSKNGSGYSTAISLLLHTGIPILSILGAYLGLPKSTPKRRKK